MERPNNVTEMIKMIGLALRNDDLDQIEFLREVNNDWIQSEDERESMDILLEESIVKIENAIF